MLNNNDIQPYIDSYAIPWGVNIGLAILIFFAGRIVVKFLVNIAGKLMLRAKLDEMLVAFVQTIVNAILMLFVTVAALNELGVDTTSLVALLGAAGLAVGLSLQDSLKNFAAGVMILVFRPFTAGHFVEAGGVAGVVESISIFTTTIRSGDNKEIIVPNGNIYGGNIINYSAKDTRRIDLTFGIGYEADIKLAKDLLTKIINDHDLVLQDPAPLVAVSELADSSVNFVARPWVKTADYWGVYFDITETVKLEFDKANISIPYPQMDVHVQKTA
jgi:small conductance mechanosensitive channel